MNRAIEGSGHTYIFGDRGPTKSVIRDNCPPDGQQCGEKCRLRGAVGGTGWSDSPILARWLLDRNGVNGSLLLPADDRPLADLLVKAAAGREVGEEILALLRRRA